MAATLDALFFSCEEMVEYKRVKFVDRAGNVHSFRAKVHKPGVSHAPRAIRGYAIATKKLGIVPSRGTAKYREWLKIAKKA